MKLLTDAGWARDAVPDASSPQLALPFRPEPSEAERSVVRETEVRPGDRVTFTSPILRHRHSASILRKVHHVLSFFPELAERPVRVGLTRQAQGLACLEDFAIWVNPHHLSHHTIAHEFTHLLQELGQVPHGERSCDLYALARHPSLNDTMPNYLELPDAMFDSAYRPDGDWGEVMFSLAREAIRQRAAGRRRYIRWFEDAIRERVARAR